MITLRSGTHDIGEHAIKGGQFHNNQPCYFEEEVLINKKLLIQVTLKTNPSAACPAMHLMRLMHLMHLMPHAASSPAPACRA